MLDEGVDPKSIYISHDDTDYTSETSSSTNDRIRLFFKLMEHLKNSYKREYIHNGDDNVYWSALSIVGTSNNNTESRWVFNFDTTPTDPNVIPLVSAKSGTKCIDGTKTINDDTCQFYRSSYLYTTDLRSFNGGIAIIDWKSGNKNIEFYIWNSITNKQVGRSVLLSNYINKTKLKNWQEFKIPIADLEINESSIFNGIRFKVISDSEVDSPDFYLDDIYAMFKGDEYDDSSLDDNFKQTALSEKTKVLEYFSSIIDQPAFSSVDHQRLRTMFVDWYSSFRSLITQSKNCSDPFNLSTDELNTLIVSFGFPYPQKITSINRKAAFMLDLVNLYKKKGTPQVLVKALQAYFGLNNVILSEWWIYKQPGDNPYFIARSQPVYPVEYRNSQDIILEIDFDTFIKNNQGNYDPLWQLSESELLQAYNTSKISLPSLTPYISVQGSFNVLSLNHSLAILNRKLQEDLDFYIENNILRKNIPLTKFEGLYSLLEVVMLCLYLFNSTCESNDDRFIYYDGDYAPLDKADKRDGYDDVDYNLIIDEYNKINIRPTTKDQQKQYLNLRTEKFTGLVDYSNINDSTFNFGDSTSSFYDSTATGKEITNYVRHPGPALAYFNPKFKAEIDSWLGGNESRRDMLEACFLDLEYYLMNVIHLIDFPITYTILGVSLEKKLGDVIDFFKPYRARIRDFITTFTIKDPLADSQLINCKKNTFVNQLIVDKGYWKRDSINLWNAFDNGLVVDRPMIIPIIEGKDHEEIQDEIVTSAVSQLNDSVGMVCTCDPFPNPVIKDRGPWGLDKGMVDSLESVTPTAIFHESKSTYVGVGFHPIYTGISPFTVNGEEYNNLLISDDFTISVTEL